MPTVRGAADVGEDVDDDVLALCEQALVALGPDDSADRARVLSQIGAEPFGSSPEKAASYLHTEIEKYAKVARAINLKID